MNKELEEAIKRALKTKQRGMCVISVEILEAVLQALNNSIPKEKVEKKIKEYHNERNKLADGHFYDSPDNINRDMSLFIASETLRLLLEEK